MTEIKSDTYFWVRPQMGAKKILEMAFRHLVMVALIVCTNH